MRSLILLKGIDQVLVCALGGSGKGNKQGAARKKLMLEILMPIQATKQQLTWTRLTTNSRIWTRSSR